MSRHQSRQSVSKPASKPTPKPVIQEPTERVPVIDADSPPWSVTTKAIAASVSLILIAIIIWRFRFLLSPLVLAGILAYLLSPVIGVVKRRFNMAHTRAVLIVYFLFIIAWAGGGVALGFVAVEQLDRLLAILPTLIPTLIERAQAVGQSSQGWTFAIGPYEIRLGDYMALLDWNDLANQLRGAIQSIVGRSGTLVTQVAQATLETIATGFLILAVAVYFSIDGPNMARTISDYAHQPGYRRDADRLMADTARIWNSYLRGQIILGLIIGAVVSVVLAILGVSNALALGILAGVLEFLPVVGPLLSAVAAVLVALFQGGNPWDMSPLVFASVVLAAMIIIQQIENYLLVPRIVGDSLELHPLVVMISVLMGTSLAGLLGAVLAAPVTATIKLLGIYVWRKLLDLPPFPVTEELTAGSRRGRRKRPKAEPAPSNGQMWQRVRGWLSIKS